MAHITCPHCYTIHNDDNVWIDPSTYRIHRGLQSVHLSLMEYALVKVLITSTEPVGGSRIDAAIWATANVDAAQVRRIIVSKLRRIKLRSIGLTICSSGAPGRGSRGDILTGGPPGRSALYYLAYLVHDGIGPAIPLVSRKVLDKPDWTKQRAA